jgi:hypothetical protein
MLIKIQVMKMQLNKILKEVISPIVIDFSNKNSVSEKRKWYISRPR